MATPEPMEFDAQDTAEVLDETNLTEDGEELANFDEIVDVHDFTSALGDGRDVRAMDADEFQDGDLDDEDLEDDEDLDDDLDDDLEDVEEDDEVYADGHDEGDGVTRLAGDETELEYVADVDGVTDPSDDDADKYESNRLSDEAIRDLGYQAEAPARGQEGDDRDKASEGSGASPEDVPDESHPRQEELLDEGVEETFPASDPVSVKRIT